MLAGLLAGAIVSSVQLAISMSNTGGAWDNSKKYTEKGELNGYFPFREKTEDMQGFKSAAEQEGNHGSVCLTNYGSTGKKLTEDKAAEDSGDIKTMLEDLKKKDKARWRSSHATHATMTGQWDTRGRANVAACMTPHVTALAEECNDCSPAVSCSNCTHAAIRRNVPPHLR